MSREEHGGVTHPSVSCSVNGPSPVMLWVRKPMWGTSSFSSAMCKPPFFQKRILPYGRCEHSRCRQRSISLAIWGFAQEQNLDRDLRCQLPPGGQLPRQQ